MSAFLGGTMGMTVLYYVKNAGKGGIFMRKCYIDNIRWITVALVVVYHVVYLFNGVAAAGVVGPFYAVQYQDALQYILYPWFMVLLFIISGMCAKYSLERQTAREFLHSRTVKLLVPSTVGLFVFHWIQGYVNIRLSGALETIAGLPGPVRYLIMVLSGTGVLWYIQMLWIFDVLLLIIRKLEKNRLASVCERTSLWVLLLLGIAVWGSAQLLNTPVVAVYRFGIYGFCFLLGYFIFSHDAVIRRLEKFCLFFAAAALFLAVVYVLYYFGENYAISPVVNSPLSAAYLWCTCLAVLGCMKRFGDKTCRFAKWMAKKSFGLYIFHYLPLSVTGMLLAQYTALAPVIIYLLTAVSAFAGAFVLYEIISRIPLLRWCVFGISKKKENRDVSG